MISLFSRRNGTASYYIGKSRSGKTLLAQYKILKAKPKRLVVWDASGQWHSACKILNYQPVQIVGLANLAETLKSNKDGIFCYSTSPVGDMKKEFSFFCAASFLYIIQSPATVVVEELSLVSQASSPDKKWQALQNQSQKYGGHLHTIIQRAQEGDKATLAQATDVYILETSANDSDYVSKALEVNPAYLPTKPLQALHIDRRGGMSALNITPDSSGLPIKALVQEKKIP